MLLWAAGHRPLGRRQRRLRPRRQHPDRLDPRRPGRRPPRLQERQEPAARPALDRPDRLRHRADHEGRRRASSWSRRRSSRCSSASSSPTSCAARSSFPTARASAPGSSSASPGRAPSTPSRWPTIDAREAERGRRAEQADRREAASRGEDRGPKTPAVERPPQIGSARRWTSRYGDRLEELLGRVRVVHGRARLPGRGRGDGRRSTTRSSPASPTPRSSSGSARRPAAEGLWNLFMPGDEHGTGPDQLGVRAALRGDGPQPRRRADGLQLRRARHRQHARSSPSTAPTSRRRAGSSRCSTATSAPASR